MSKNFVLKYPILKGSSWVGAPVRVCLCVMNFLNCYKMANNGWILDFKVSMEESSRNASIYFFEEKVFFTMEGVAPLENDPILLGMLIR